MANEYIFLVHVTLVSVCLLAALRYGKEALMALITLYCILANSFVIKQTTLCGLNASCTDAFMIGAVLGLNLMQEFYGKAAARLAIGISFAGSCLYALMGIIHILYTPSATDTAHSTYTALLTPVPRIVIASLIVYLVVQVIDYYLFGLLKRLIGSRFLVPRLWITIAITQLIDTVLFSYLGLYGIIDNLGQLILVSYTLKMLVLIVSTPFMALSKKMIQRARS